MPGITPGIRFLSWIKMEAPSVGEGIWGNQKLNPTLAK